MTAVNIAGTFKKDDGPTSERQPDVFLDDAVAAAKG